MINHFYFFAITYFLFFALGSCVYPHPPDRLRFSDRFSHSFYKESLCRYTVNACVTMNMRNITRFNHSLPTEHEAHTDHHSPKFQCELRWCKTYPAIAFTIVTKPFQYFHLLNTWLNGGTYNGGGRSDLLAKPIPIDNYIRIFIGFHFR